MGELNEILRGIVEHQKANTRYFFNLLEVLMKHHVINAFDLDYIRHHGENEE